MENSTQEDKMAMTPLESHPDSVSDDVSVDDRVRRVKFTDVEVIMCSLRLSGNPACSDYVALELDTELGRDEKVTVEYYETSRPECRRRRDTDLRLTRFDREEILNFYGCTRSDVEEFVMELRAELRSHEEAERTRAGARFMNRAKSMVSGIENNESDSDSDDDDGGGKRSSNSAVFTMNEMNAALDILDLHRHFVPELAPKNINSQAVSASGGSASSASASMNSLQGSMPKKVGQTRALVLKTSMEEISPEYSKTAAEKLVTDSSSVTSKTSTSSKSGRRKTNLFGKREEKTQKGKKSIKKATDLYLLSGTGFGPLGSM